MDSIYILDAVNYIFRAYYAIGPMSNPQGVATSGLYGFIRSVQKVLKTFSPSHIVAVFDGPDNAQARQELYPEYKMHRKKAPDDLYPQIDLAYEFCLKAGISCLRIPKVEADDTMATIATWAKKLGKTAYLCTSDKDLFQIVCDHIYVINIHKDNLLIDTKKVEEIYGVLPEQMLDLLAIMGDASDNIPGLTGFGPKTAAKLLQTFGTLENILENPEKISGKKKQETVKKEREKALFSKQLATLQMNVSIPQEESFYEKKNEDLPALEAFYKHMHFKTLLQELEKKPVVESKSDTNNHTITTQDLLEQTLEKLAQYPLIAFDTETTHLDVLDAEIVGVGFAVDTQNAYYIPFNTNIDKKVLLASLRKFFANPKLRFVAHNAKYDLHVLQNHNIVVKNLYFDTMIASYLLHPEKRKHSLDALCLEYFDKTKISWDSLFADKKNPACLQDLPIEKVATYCCEDVEYTYKLQELLAKKLKEKELEHLFFTIEMPLVPILVGMERSGIFVDTKILEKQGLSLTEQKQAIEKEIYKEAKKTFNINSPKQLSEILFTELEIPKPARTKTSTATGAKTLEALQDYPIVEKVLEYRTVDKLLSTYVLALPKAVHPKTDRIHCTFNQAVVATGRLSCTNPNLQNIPIRSSEGNKIREAFRPQNTDWVYVSADYSQIELRLLAHFSQDKQLIKAFQENQDIHSYTASLIYDVSLDKVTKDMRRCAKTVNFGILYGQTAFGLAQQLGIARKEAQRFITTYFARYPEISSYMDACVAEAKNRGFCSTISGRKRPVLELQSKNPMIRKAAERLAINTPLQGSAADLIKIAMKTIEQQLSFHEQKAFLVLQIHDELIFEAPKKEIFTLKAMIKKEMENAADLRVPLLVDISVGNNWAEC